MNSWEFGEVICHEQSIITADIETGARAEVNAIKMNTGLRHNIIVSRICAFFNRS